MIQSFVDTNVLVRFFVGDNKRQQTQVRHWFAEVNTGVRKIVITSIVVAETVFVLESFYKKSHEEIAATLLPFLALPVLDVPERDVLTRLWGLYIDGFHFVDSYLLACARVSGVEILTFDTELKKRLSL